METNEYRYLELRVGSDIVADGQRIRVRGSSNMTLLPDFFLVDIYNVSGYDMAIIKDKMNITVVGDKNSVLCKGDVEDIYVRFDDENEITTLAVSDGGKFWNSFVSKTVGSGSTVRDAIVRIMDNASFGGFLADDKRLPRGQTFVGRIAESISMLAKSVDARSYITHEVVYVVGKGKSSEIIDIYDEELVTEQSVANGIVMIKTIMKSYPIGIIAMRNQKKYRVVSQKFDADNFTGAWDSQVILVDEDEIRKYGMEGG